MSDRFLSLGPDDQGNLEAICAALGHVSGASFVLCDRRRHEDLLAVADVIEAMSSQRPYRAALGTGAALEEIEGGRGVRYDAEVCDVCLRLFREERFTFVE